MSNEELEKQKEAVRQQAVALSWMRKHIYDYSPCLANSQMLGAYLEEHGLSFSEDSLDIATDALKDKLAPSAVKPPTAAPATPAPDELPAVPAGCPALTTRAEVNAMSRPEFRRWYHHHKYGAAFRDRITAIFNRPEGI